MAYHHDGDATALAQHSENMSARRGIRAKYVLIPRPGGVLAASVHRSRRVNAPQQ